MRQFDAASILSDWPPPQAKEQGKSPSIRSASPPRILAESVCIIKPPTLNLVARYCHWEYVSGTPSMFPRQEMPGPMPAAQHSMAAALPGRTDGSENEPSSCVQKPVQQPLLRPLQQPSAFACSNTGDVRTTKVEKLSGRVGKRSNQDSYASLKKHDAIECRRLLRIPFHVESRCRGP